MDLQHVNVIVYAAGEADVDPARFLEVFHRWIRDDVLDELLVDVADYRHVPAGPDVILVGHDANYSLERFAGRYGLRYNRKTPLGGSNLDRLAQAYQAAIHACRLLEEELAGKAGFRFSRRALALFVNDRALAPNRGATRAACLPEIESFLRDHLGASDFVLEPAAGRHRRFGVEIRLARAVRFAA